jgi:IS5 family transposase
LNVVYDKPRKSNAGAKPIDAVLMFKILVLQQLNNLSDDRIEYQIRDRLSFMRFLGLQIESRVPDAKTIWLFRERLKELNLIEELFEKFHEQLAAQGYVAKAGQMIDATFVEAPRQRNNREENATIKSGEIPQDSHENPRRFVIDPGFYDASILRKAGRFKKFRMRGLHGSLQFVVPAGDWSCWYSSS